MKLKMIIVSLLMIGSMTFYAQSKTEKFKVYGNCGMCETRIEKAVNSLDGVTKADWDKETKFITITFDSNIVTLNEIHKAIANVGHDTDMVKAKDSVYDELPGCCHYDRPDSSNMDHGHKH